MSLSFPCPICELPPSDLGRELNGYSLSVCTGCRLVYAPGALAEEVDYTALHETEAYRRDQVEFLRNIGSTAEIRNCATYLPFFDQHRPRGEARLLDVGCGVGKFCRAAQESGWSVRGVDIARSAVRVGRELTDLQLECVALDQVEARGDTYEVVTAFEVLEHLSDPRSFLDRCRRLLAKGGRVFCTVPNWECEPVASATRLDWVPPVHKLFFSRGALESLARAAGLVDVRVGRIFTDPRPRRLRSVPRWVLRRISGPSRVPLGLWLSARRGPR